MECSVALAGRTGRCGALHCPRVKQSLTKADLQCDRTALSMTCLMHEGCHWCPGQFTYAALRAHLLRCFASRYVRAVRLANGGWPAPVYRSVRWDNVCRWIAASDRAIRTTTRTCSTTVLRRTACTGTYPQILRMSVLRASSSHAARGDVLHRRAFQCLTRSRAALGALAGDECKSHTFVDGARTR
jgi:hypothetical protein